LKQSIALSFKIVSLLNQKEIIGINFATTQAMKNTLIYTDFKGRLLLGEISEQTENTIKVAIIYPFYGVFLRAQPKMCMLFSDKSQPKLAEKLLINCFELSQRIEKQKKELVSDFKILSENLSKSRSREEKGELTKEFIWMYLNGFKTVPELLTNPEKDLIAFLENHFEENKSLQINTADYEDQPHNSPEKEEILRDWNNRNTYEKLAFVAHSVQNGTNQWIYPLFEKEFLMRLA